MKKEPKINVLVTGTDNPEVMNNFYNSIAKFWSSEIYKRVNKLDISHDEKIKLVDRVMKAIADQKEELTAT